MKRYLICSDIHGRINNFEYALKDALSGQLDGVIIAGDMEIDVSSLVSLIDEMAGDNIGIKKYFVRGNCDSSRNAPQTKDMLVFDLDEKTKCLLTHGNNYQVKSDLDTLLYVAEYRGADIAIYGHTHLYEDRKIGKVRVLNPGALRGGFDRPSYVILTADNGVINAERRII